MAGFFALGDEMPTTESDQPYKPLAPFLEVADELRKVYHAAPYRPSEDGQGPSMHTGLEAVYNHILASLTGIESETAHITPEYTASKLKEIIEP